MLRPIVRFLAAAVAVGALQAAPAGTSSGTASLDLSRRIPVVHVSIDGQGPFPFVVDTALETAVIDRGLAQRLELEGRGPAWIGEAGAPGSVQGEKVVLPRLQVAGVLLTAVEAVSLEADAWMAGDALQGALALGSFGRRLVTLDYASSRLVLEEGQLPQPDGDQVLAAELEGGAPLVPIQVAGRRMNASLSSNRFGGVVLPVALMEQLPLEGEPGVIGRTRTPEGTFPLFGGVLDGDVRIGGHLLRRPRMMFSDGQAHPNIGPSALGDFAVTFDAGTGRVRIQPRESQRVAWLQRQAAAVAPLDGGDDLRAAFNAERDKVRLLFILSPT